MSYPIIKALHLIFMVCWFVGLLYMGRLFVYLADAQLKPDPDKQIITNQLALMAKRLWYIITWPSAILTILFGLHLLMSSYALSQPWMHAKLLLLLILISYHLWCGRTRKKQGYLSRSAKSFKILNEIPTLILVAIVFLAVTQSTHIFLPTLLTVIGFGLIAMVTSKLLKK